MAKTPYEVRLDILSMAKDMLEKEYEHDIKAKGETPKEYITSNNIITRANELYAFVNDTTGSEARYASGSSDRNRTPRKKL